MHHNNIYKTRASLQKKIAVIICGLFFSIILLEIGIRLGGLILLYRQEYRNVQAIKQNGVYRIMCLGESTTAGQYPGPLEDILNKRNVGIRFSVIDKGIVGINTVVILSQLQQNLDTYKPNMVIVMAGNNDMGIKYYKGIPEVNATVFRHWRIYRLMRLLYMRIIKKLKKQDIYGLALLKPENDNNYLKLGRLYQTQGKYPQAEELFKKAIELNPGNNFAYIGLGWIYRVQGEYSKAEELFKKIISLYPENYRAYGAMSVLYEEMGEPELAKGYTGNAANGPRLGYYNPVTVNSYRKFKEILSRRGIRLVCVQYPMRSLGPLRKIFENDEKGVIFVDNERVFKEAVKKEGFGELFLDMSGGDFGHCTKKGNALLAENIANVILTEAFSK